MRYYLKDDVYTTAIKRIEYLYDEFEEIIVNFSGGKDSTVVLFLTLEVARRRNRLPVNVLFIDQELEWQATIDYVDIIMRREDVRPLWLQIPFKETTSTSHEKGEFKIWDKEEEDLWIRPQSDISIKENTFGTEQFYDLFGKSVEGLFPDAKNIAKIGGVRGEESPARLMGITMNATYKWITWGKIENKKKDIYTFYPVYDWSYKDVWKYIHDNKLKYCKLYDYMYQYGIKLPNMRVSAIQHETAIRSLFWMQEVEPKTWQKLTKRLQGANTVGQMGEANYYIPKDVPRGFSGWKEYRDYLLENLITDKEAYKKFKIRIDRMDKKYEPIADFTGLYRVGAQAVIINDYYGVKLGNYEKNTEIIAWRMYMKRGEFSRLGYNKVTNYYIENYGTFDKENTGSN